MHLKKLELIGFKSFPDRTSVEFSAGITGVVGPNGCGKSNIADAFRWVMGEQSAKSMRGGKMHDVIFAGTANRKPVNFAEVTITLSNADGTLPIEYEEVAVTRRLHRSGESEYLLNRHSVRLKDLHSLFMDSGIGKNAFSIFEQGKVDQVINLGPIERRYIFEEAAGIVRFLQRKREAFRKLEHANNNMARVQDVYSEVKTQIKVLERQAEQARRYRDNKERLEALEKAVGVAKWDSMHGRVVEGEQCHKGFTDQLDKGNALAEELQKQLAQAKVDLQRSEQELSAASEAVYRARSDKELKAQEQRSQRERIKEIGEKKKALEQEIKQLHAKSRERKAENKACATQKQKLQQQLEKMKIILQQHKDAAAAAEEQLVKLRDNQHNSHRERLALVEAEHRLAGEIKEKSIRLEGHEEKSASLQRRKKERAEDITNLQENIQARRQKVRQSIEAVDKHKKTFSTLEQKQKGVVEELGRLEQEQNQLQQMIAETQARYKALVRLREEMEGFSAGAKTLLKESSNTSSTLHSKVKGLYEVLTPSQGNEEALAAAMRPYAQTLVVDNKSDLDAVVDFAKEKQLTDVSLLCLEDVDVAAQKNDDDKGAELLCRVSDDAVEGHFLQGVYKVKDVPAAMKVFVRAPHAEAWTEEGIFVDRRKVSFYATGGESNVFARESELKALAKSLQESKTRVSQLNNTVAALEKQRAQLQTERLNLDKEIRRGEMVQVEVNFALQQAKKDLEEAKDEKKQIEAQMGEGASLVKTLSTELKELVKTHGAAQKQVLQAQKAAADLDDRLKQADSNLQDKKLKQKEAEEAFNSTAQGLQQYIHSIEVLAVKDQESQQQGKRFLNEIAANDAVVAEMKGQSSDNVQQIGDVENTLSGAVSACQALKKVVDAKKKDIVTIEKKTVECSEKIKRVEKDQYQRGVQEEQAKTLCESIENDLQERYHLTIEETRKLELPLEQSIEHSEKVIRILRKKIEDAGDINMTSIEEFEKNKVRYEFLEKQIDDMGGSQEELLAIITKLDNESRKVFKEVFEKIRSNFRKNFEILFNGGEADLRFTDAVDILEAGIEIVAKPPGKQMRSINLLSGGEKCLTALALLFAIFEFKPAPFCILDEIDAPLDDTNVERFVNVVKQFIDRCQFIIITHNKRTMAIADQLFGVSMEEKGVSKLLTMRFTEAQQEVSLV